MFVVLKFFYSEESIPLACIFKWSFFSYTLYATQLQFLFPLFVEVNLGVRWHSGPFKVP